MGLYWGRLDVTMPRNPKIVSLLEVKEGHRAAFVWLCAICWSVEQGTDGFIPRSSLHDIRGRKVDCDRISEVGLWDEVAGGWLIPGWDEFQQSDEETKRRRHKLMLRSAKGNCVRHHGPDCGCYSRLES